MRARQQRIAVMKTTPPSHIETQYRLVGRRHNGSINISWYDTFDAALDNSREFVESMIFRPDGSYVGMYAPRQEVGHV
jgi:prepilin-type processing-associated H-X9-DG protein